MKKNSGKVIGCLPLPDLTYKRYEALGRDAFTRIMLMWQADCQLARLLKGLEEKPCGSR